MAALADKVLQLLPGNVLKAQNLHQAMFEVEDADAEPGTVVQVLRTGYTIGDRLLLAREREFDQRYQGAKDLELQRLLDDAQLAARPDGGLLQGGAQAG